MTEMNPTPGGNFGPRRLSIELTNICNLHCSYCLRDAEALYHSPANFLAPEFLEKVIKQAREVMALERLAFTGGEPTLHPQFADILELGEAYGLRTTFVTNGWHFERIWPVVLAHRATIASIGFSVDGITRETHDRWRGEGSFVRLVRAFALCQSRKIPFAVKVTIRQDTVQALEQIALFSARLGAASLNFAHLLPTSNGVEDDSGLSLEERRRAEQEIANLAQIFKMKIGIDVGYYNVDVSPPCSALAGVSANIDYRGYLSLCCNLSGFRGAFGEADIAADLNVEDFAPAYQRLKLLAANQLEARRSRLRMMAELGEEVDLNTGSPCLFCLNTLGKLPWRERQVVSEGASRSLPVVLAK